MPDPAPVYISGGLGQAVEMAVFMILVSVILAVFWYIIIWVLGVLFKPKSRQGFGNYGDQEMSKLMKESNPPPAGRAFDSERPGAPIGRSVLNGPW